MATLLKVLNNLADIKSAGGVALRVRTQEAFMAELARKPRFVRAEPSGESFIIGGQNPQASKLPPEEV
jgi:hypothetical protein